MLPAAARMAAAGLSRARAARACWPLGMWSRVPEVDHSVVRSRRACRTLWCTSTALTVGVFWGLDSAFFNSFVVWTLSLTPSVRTPVSALCGLADRQRHSPTPLRHSTLDVKLYDVYYDVGSQVLVRCTYHVG